MIDPGRRVFLTTGSCFFLLYGLQQPASAYAPDLPAPVLPIIDTHIHLFDTRRPAGVPWPDQADTVLYRPALPPRYNGLAMPVGVVGAIAVECSPLGLGQRLAAPYRGQTHDYGGGVSEISIQPPPSFHDSWST